MSMANGIVIITTDYSPLFSILFPSLILVCVSVRTCSPRVFATCRELCNVWQCSNPTIACSFPLAHRHGHSSLRTAQFFSFPPTNGTFLRTQSPAWRGGGDPPPPHFATVQALVKMLMGTETNSIRGYDHEPLRYTCCRNV